MKTKYEVTWTEKRLFKCSLTVEANSEAEAYDMVASTDTCDKEEETNDFPEFKDWIGCKEKV